MRTQALALLFVLSFAGSAQNPSVQPKPSVGLGSAMTQPITLHMTANADAVYKRICKLAGIDVVFAPDYHPAKLTVELTDVSLREALDVIGLQTHTYWRFVSATTIFVWSQFAQPRPGVPLGWDQKTACL